MTSEKLAQYLRTHRKRVGLSQDELAWLMGCESGSKVSRHETSSGKPALENVLAYEIIFQRPARELFAGIFEAVQLVVCRRAAEMMKDLEQGKGGGQAAKLAALRLIAESGPVEHKNGGNG